jgi:hypothetical protein
MPIRVAVIFFPFIFPVLKNKIKKKLIRLTCKQLKGPFTCSILFLNLNLKQQCHKSNHQLNLNIFRRLRITPKEE